MTAIIHGTWPQPLPLLTRWLNDHADATTRTQPPKDMKGHLPLILLSPAPGYTGTGYTRSPAVDIDVYAADWKTMGAVIQRIEAALFTLQGDGNQYGYVDTCELTGFAQQPHAEPGVLRCTATATLALRPQ